MSAGPGVVQRRVALALREAATTSTRLTAEELAQRVYGLSAETAPTRSQLVAVRRVLRPRAYPMVVGIGQKAGKGPKQRSKRAYVAVGAVLRIVEHPKVIPLLYQPELLKAFGADELDQRYLSSLRKDLHGYRAAVLAGNYVPRVLYLDLSTWQILRRLGRMAGVAGA